MSIHFQIPDILGQYLHDKIYVFYIYWVFFSSVMVLRKSKNRRFYDILGEKTEYVTWCKNLSKASIDERVQTPWKMHG